MINSSANFTAPEISRCRRIESLDVQVEPRSLTFGLGTHQVPVDKILTEELTLRNTQSQDVHALVSVVEKPSDSYKYLVRVLQPEPFIISPGKEEKVTIKMKVLCTTTFMMELLVKSWKDDESKFKEMILPFCSESELSKKLDPEELKHDKVINTLHHGVEYNGEYRGIHVAIKEFIDCPGMRDYFRKEINLLENIRHPSIVEYIGRAFAHGKLSIVTAQCQYGNMTNAMSRYHDAFKKELKLKCLLDISNAMRFLHRSGIVHRDLRPDNILISSLEPEAEVCAKLSNFGFARDLNRSQSETLHTRTGALFFMAPEMMKLEPYDQSIDVYSFGMLMEYVLGGKMPFTDDLSEMSPSTFAQEVISGKRPAIPPTCPPLISELIARCWREKPSERPSFEEIHGILEEAFEECRKRTIRINIDDCDALLALGKCYLKGDGVAQDRKRALELFQQAVQLGCSDGGNSLGSHLEEKEGGAELVRRQTEEVKTQNGMSKN